MPVLVRDREYLQKVVHKNPFEEKEEMFLHVTFLHQKPEQDALKNLKDVRRGEEVYHVVDDVAYLSCPDGYGRTKLTNTFFEKQLAVTATTRNWKTINTLLDLST